MEEFNSIEKVKELFEKEKCEGKENIYFIAYKDVQKSSGMVNGMEYPYDAVIINQTDKGIGMIYLVQPGLVLTQNLTKMNIKEGSFQFIKSDEIEEIKIKNYALFNSKTKRISIKTKDKNHKLYAKLLEKNIPYQTENFEKFIQKYM